MISNNMLNGLSPEESALVNHYRSADDRARYLIVALARVNANNNPRDEVPDVAVPRLRLIVGGAA